MTEDIEKLIEEIQQKIKIDMEKAYSKIVINESRSPSNFGYLDDSDAVGEIKGPCSDTMKIALEIKNGRITNACFWTNGCGPTIACGSMLTKMIKGKYLREIKDISSLQLLEALEGLPVEHTHCSILAINTLHKAIKNYYKKE